MTNQITPDTVRLSTGARLFVNEQGDGDELVVFLHAVGGDHSSWTPQLEALSGRYKCVSFDLRGHNRSSAPDGSVSAHVAGFAQDTIALIEHLQYARAHLVGLSLGGVIALEVFKQRPDVVQSLTLANTWAFHPEAQSRIAFMKSQLCRMSLPESSAELLPSLFAAGTADEVIKRAIAIEAAKDPDVFLNSWISMFNVDYRSSLERINVPLLLVGGSADAVTPTDPLLTAIYAAVPLSQLVNIEGAGHFSNLDHPEEFTRALAIHLSRARAIGSQRLKSSKPSCKLLEADTVAHGLIALLSERGIEYFFSNSGTDFTPIIDAFARYQVRADFSLKPIVAPHENTAIAMAHGHYLLSGRPQCVMAHTNVGTANMGLGIINAARSRIPMLVMAGRTPWYESDVDGCRTNFVQWGQDTFDQAAYFREFTKWDYELKGGRNLETVIDRALALSQSAPAGPVYLTLPKEPLCERLDGLTISSQPRQTANWASAPSHEAVRRAASLMAIAKRPVIVTADLGRYRGGPEALVQIAQRYAIKVVEHGKRNFFNFPTDHPMHVGFSPSPHVENADLLIVIESPVPWVPALSGMEEPCPVIQIGVDPLRGDLPMRSFPVDVNLAGDPALALKMLLDELSRHYVDPEEIGVRSARIKDEHDLILATIVNAARSDSKLAQISKRYLSYCIGEAVDDQVIIFNEYNLEPQLVPRRLTDSWFENSVASGLGWSLGAALGAQLARPELTMLVALGDGSYLFNTPLSAHYVAAAYQLPIIIVVFNDSAWSTIKKSYLSTTRSNWAERTGSFPLCEFPVTIAFEKLAESSGGVGLRVERPEDVEPSLQRAITIARNERTHCLVNVICERDA